MRARAHTHTHTHTHTNTHGLDDIPNTSRTQHVPMVYSHRTSVCVCTHAWKMCGHVVFKRRYLSTFVRLCYVYAWFFCICVYTRAYIYIYIYIYMSLCRWSPMCVQVRAHKHTRTWLHHKRKEEYRYTRRIWMHARMRKFVFYGTCLSHFSSYL